MRFLFASLFAAAVSAQAPLPLCVKFTVGTAGNLNILDAIVGDEVIFTKTPGDEIVAFGSEAHWRTCQMSAARAVPDSDGAEFRAELKNAGTLYLASKQGCIRGTKMKLATEGCGDHAHNPRCYGAAGFHSADHSTDSSVPPPDMTHPMYCGDADEQAISDCPVCEACPEPQACDCAAAAEEPANKPTRPRAGAGAKRKKDSVTIVWASPAKNFNTGVDTYSVSYQQGKLPAVDVELADPTDTMAVVTGLTSGKVHTFSVVAHNSKGESKPLKFKAKTRK